MLTLADFSGGYRAGVTIVEGLTLELGTTPVTSVVGSNGAGKTTMLRGICGLLGWHRGEIRFAGDRIDHLSAHESATPLPIPAEPVVTTADEALARNTPPPPEPRALTVRLRREPASPRVPVPHLVVTPGDGDPADCFPARGHGTGG